MSLKDFFKGLAGSPALLPHVIRIPNINTDDPDGLAGLFEPQQHYFTVRVNEMFLSEKRQWFKEIEPMVVCLNTYIYGEQEIDNPVVVGKSLIESKIQNVPEGMVFNDTRVAGIHPYSGGRLIVSMVLCQSVTKDYLADTLEFVEKISGVFGESITLLIGSYYKIANVIIGAIDKLFDSKAVKPLFGFRQEFDRDANDRFAPGYYVMIDKSEVKWDPENFFVKENRLYYGKEAGKAKPFREDEYVLFSITRSDERTDIQLLPFWKSYKKILDQMEGGEFSEELRNRVKGMLRSLNVEMQKSPDLTQPDAKRLITKYIDAVGKVFEQEIKWSAAPKKTKDFWDEIDGKISAM